MSYLKNMKTAVALMDTLQEGGIDEAAFQCQDWMDFVASFPQNGSEFVFGIQPNKKNKARIVVGIQSDMAQIDVRWERGRKKKMWVSCVLCKVEEAALNILTHQALEGE